ncbi:BTAD domain-containing putative transcriptional regulator [Actinoplanes sp. NPDC051343]|uniref:AfsR/SARP family transcriptional regulator n=1 Tax=Actinoplanes sp. NPDC051343 TaxID=3363906 RepID=UPI00378EA36C
MRFAVLGPVRAWREGQELSLGTRQQRQVLGMLLVAGGAEVPTHQFIDMLWGHRAPASAVNSLHRFVGALRRILEPDLPKRSTGQFLHRRGTGYRLLTHDAAVDLADFRSLTAEARDADSKGLTELALKLYLQALNLCHGRCAEDGSAGARISAFAAVDEEYAAVARAGGRTAVAAGRVGDLLPAVRRVAEMSPLDEALQAQLMRMLAAEGRQSDAFTLFQTVRDSLSRDLGTDPGSELKAAYADVLRPAPQTRSGPASAVAVRPAQIPRDLPVFVGRGDDTKRANQLLGAAEELGTMPIVAIDGMPGVGKSTFAVHWAHAIASRFPGGHLYLDLRGPGVDATALTADEALHRLLTSLGIRSEAIPQAGSAREALFRSHVAGRRLLVLLDNADNAEQVRPLLPGASDCLVILTSRARLTSLEVTHGAQPFTLGLPSAEDARELLARRLSKLPGFDERAVRHHLDAIVSNCGQLPGALATVAVQTIAYPHLDLASFADRQQFFDGRLCAFAEPGQADLWTIVGWSYRKLSGPAARLLRLLSLHPAMDISVAAAASLAGQPITAIQPSIAELSRGSLVVASAGRLGLHPIIRAFARALTDRVDDPATTRQARARLFQHYLLMAQVGTQVMTSRQDSDIEHAVPAGVTITPFADFRAAMEWFRARIDTLNTMLQEADEASPDLKPWQFAMALLPYFQYSGLVQQWRETMTSALHMAERRGDLTGQAHMHRCVAGAFYYLGDHGRARDHLRHAQQMFAGQGSLIDQAHVHVNIGLTLVGEANYGLPGGNNPTNAQKEFRTAQRLYAEARHPKGIASALQGLARCQAALGDQRAAVDLFEQALAKYLSINDVNSVAGCLNGLGNLWQRCGDHGLAADYFREAIDIYRKHGNRPDEAFTLVSLGEAMAGNGDASAAARAWRAALQILEELRLPAVTGLRDRLRSIASAAIT